MSLYNMLMGEDANAKDLMEMLNAEYALYPPRYRDCYIYRNKICILTRTGGGNRDDYEEENNAMELHPLYKHNCDWIADSTYAQWFFRFPAQHREKLQSIAKKEQVERRKERQEFEKKEGYKHSDDTSDSE